MNIERALSALEELHPNVKFHVWPHPQTGIPCIHAIINDEYIHDPTLSENGFDEVLPSYYGLSREAADIMKSFY